MEDRPLLEHKTAGFRAIDLGAGNVGREQVGGELDAVKLGFDAFGQLLDRFGLGEPGGALNQHVTISEQGNQQPFDEFFLAEDLT